VAAEVREIDGNRPTEWDNYGDETGLQSIPGDYCRRGARLFLKAATEAYEDSGLGEVEAHPASIGIAAGGSVAYFDMDVASRFFRMRSPDGRELDMRRFVAEGALPKNNFYRRIGDLMAVLPAKKLGIGGPVMVIDTACAASGHAIGQAFRMVQRGRVKAMLAGGAAALVGPLTVLYFAVLGALSRNPDPKLASRPFDRDRDGFVMGEGGGAVVLEDLDHARARGARIYAELAGYGSSMNGHNLTDPSPNGADEARTMELALQDASLSPEHIDYIAAHGTSTPKNDATETLAIKRAFGEHAKKLMVSSCKGQIGHTLSGAAACNLIFAVKAIESGCVPPTMHYSNADPECDLDYVPNLSRQAQVRAALANSFAFGGQNAVLAVKAYG
jgi:3-oxoacyl-[acyl-carrier-protein] synthase II